MKRYHTYCLNLGLGENGDEWEIQQIGTVEEKSSVEKELQELRDRLAKVEEMTKRREEIEEELNMVWVKDGDKQSEELPPPTYIEVEKEKQLAEGLEEDVDDEESGSGELVGSEEVKEARLEHEQEEVVEKEREIQNQKPLITGEGDSAQI